MRRTILHCDLNCFFASVEMLYHPEFRNVPMAIAGDPECRHGIILAKNVPARQKGIKTAETIAEARRKCPELIIRKPDYQTYEYFSERVRSLYYEYTDQVEPFGADECWLDITGSISYFGSAMKIVEELLYRVKNEIGLTLSIGISFNKIYAKLGSDLAKEDSYCDIDSLDEIKDMPASALLGVGNSMYEKLKLHGMRTIGDIALSPPGYLESIMGKWGETLRCFAGGNDLSEVRRYEVETEEAKSIGNSHTAVRDLYDMDDLKLVLHSLCENVASRLHQQGLYYRTVHLYLRNNLLETRILQETLKDNSDLGKDIFDSAIRLFERHCNFCIPYRTVGVSVSRLSCHRDDLQTDLFSDDSSSDRIRKQEGALEDIRRRFGRQSVCTLRMLEDSELADYGLKEEHGFFPVSYRR